MRKYKLIIKNREAGRDRVGRFKKTRYKVQFKLIEYDVPDKDGNVHARGCFKSAIPIELKHSVGFSVQNIQL
jgi:hypothetical protein